MGTRPNLSDQNQDQQQTYYITTALKQVSCLKSTMVNTNTKQAVTTIRTSLLFNSQSMRF